MMKKKAKKILPEEIEIFKDCRAHVRHIEGLRAGFMNFFVVSTAAGIAFLGKDNPNPNLIYWWMLIFSIVGLAYSCRIQATLNIYEHQYKNLILNWNISEKIDDKAYGCGESFSESLAGRVGISFPTIIVYVLIYGVTATYCFHRIFCHLPGV